MFIFLGLVGLFIAGSVYLGRMESNHYRMVAERRAAERAWWARHQRDEGAS